MRLFLLLILTIASNFTLLAQKGSHGFIVTLERDTIRGFIQDGTDAELALGITFKKTTTSEEVKYLPTSITSFSFDYGRTFKQFFISKDSDERDFEVVFAKNILEGKISLYTFSKKNQDEPDIFLVNNHAASTFYLKEPQKIKIIAKNGETVTGESYQHIGVLTLVKGDSVSPTTNSKKFRYSEKEIRKDILKYNERFKNDFPMDTYHPQINYRYEISAGLSMLSSNEVDVFRVAAYRHKYFPEKSRKISFIRGISYRYTYSNTTIDASVQNSNQNFRQQFLSFIPIGFNFQSDSKTVKPYIYLGAGLAFLLETNRQIVNYEDKGNVNKIIVFPTLNVGAGMKIRAGSDFIIAEVTPTGNKSGICINLGYSF